MGNFDHHRYCYFFFNLVQSAHLELRFLLLCLFGFLEMELFGLLEMHFVLCRQHLQQKMHSFCLVCYLLYQNSCTFLVSRKKSCNIFGDNLIKTNGMTLLHVKMCRAFSLHQTIISWDIWFSSSDDIVRPCRLGLC